MRAASVFCIALIACGGSAQPATNTPPHAVDATQTPGFRDLVGAPRELVEQLDAKRASREIVFVDEKGRLVTSSECTTRAEYTWMPERDARVVKLAGADDTRDMLVGSEIAEHIVAGHALRASVATSGRFVIAESARVVAPPGCTATRYASSITVGAYAMAWINPRVGNESGMGSTASRVEQALPELSRGLLGKCALDPVGPPADCATPVAIVAQPLSPP